MTGIVVPRSGHARRRALRLLTTLETSAEAPSKQRSRDCEEALMHLLVMDLLETQLKSIKFTCTRRTRRRRAAERGGRLPAPPQHWRPRLRPPPGTAEGHLALLTTLVG